MPTGYTSKLYDGQNISKEEYIWDCARAFGALASMRDEPMDAKIPEEFKADPYYLHELEKAKGKLMKTLTLPLDEIEKRVDTEYAKSVAGLQEMMEGKKALKERYEKMLKEVTEWEPPTEDHVKLKEFCMDQLNMSINFDCNVNNKYADAVLTKTTPEEWLANEVESIKKDIAYLQKQWDEEQKRVEEKNKWIRELRNSLQTKQ